MVKKNKRGWTKIVEAVMAVLLIALFLLFVLEQRESSYERNISEEIFEVQNAILREIQLNSSLRSSILESSVPLSTLEENFPSDVKIFLEEKTSENLNCAAKICNLTEEEICSIDEIYENVEGNIYVRQVLIFSEVGLYEPRNFRLFCWF
jgi:hypothetical protein